MPYLLILTSSYSAVRGLDAAYVMWYRREWDS